MTKAYNANGVETPEFRNAFKRKKEDKQMALTDGWLMRAIEAHKTLTKTQIANRNDAKAEFIRAQFIALKEKQQMRTPYAQTPSIIVEAKAILALYNYSPDWHDLPKAKAVGLMMMSSNGVMNPLRAGEIFEQMVTDSGLTVVTSNV